MYSAMSVAGVIGYPANTRHPAAIAPSVHAYVPASSTRRPLVVRRAHSLHGATSSDSFTSETSVLTVSSSYRFELRLERHVDAEVGTDLVAQHAADAVRLRRRVHREPS